MLLVAAMLSVFYPYNLFRKVSRFINFIYSASVKRTFAKAGSNFFIERDAQVLGGKHIEIGDNFLCFARLRLEAYSEHNGVRFNPRITIGNNVSLNYDCHIAAVNSISIGNGVLIASKVFITDHYHGTINAEALAIPPAQRTVQSPGKVVIEDNVWIGEGVAVLPNVTIGKNSIIGANSVVTGNIPADSVAAGVPARVIRKLQ